MLEAIPRLRRYSRSLTHETNEADDLTQQTLERALAHWRQFDPERDMLVWLLSIAHNAFLDGRRRDARMQFSDPADVQRTMDAEGGSPGTDVGLCMDLLAALARLSPEQREPLVLVCVEQLSYAEVAEALRIPIGTVMSRVCRARQALRRHLEGPAKPEGREGPAPLRRVV
ncbi:MAG: sigma-70 family RNA polymerase sigma factor [Burkholderiales bacterium]|nr:sigma-70 family RNA polymerase sigma factor [Burkholderiales bacterium]